MNAVVNTKIVLEDSLIWDGVVTYENSRIVSVGKTSEIPIPPDAKVIDAKGLYTAPGLIDIHNHGGPDEKFADDPAGCISHVLSHGVTTVLPTLYCDMTIPRLIECTRILKAAKTQKFGGVIGPYMGGFGSNQNGIVNTGGINSAEYSGLVGESAGFAKIWAIDPAREGIEGFMRDVLSADPRAIFAMGHSHATAQECRRLRRFPLRVQTHHSDSGKAKGRAQGTVGAGCDEYTLYDPEVFAEIISDENGVHVDPDMLRMVLRTKGVEKTILISDSMPDKNHYKNNEADGIMFGPDLNYDYEGHLAGSRLTLERACRNMMAHTGCGIVSAVRMASLNPARLLGIDSDYGSIEAGKIANLIIADDMMNVKKVIFEGETYA